MTRTRREFLQLSAGAAAAALLAARRRARAAAPPQKRLLVLGGTQFLGPEVVAAARARNWTITLFNRGKTNPQLFPDLEKLVGDRKDDLRALAGRTFEAVIDNSGYFPRHVRESA